MTRPALPGELTCINENCRRGGSVQESARTDRVICTVCGGELRLVPGDVGGPHYGDQSEAQRPKPRLLLGTYWLAIAALCVYAGSTGLEWGIAIGLACGAYAIYLYLGGRHGFIVW